MIFSMFIELCNHYCTPVLIYFHHSEKEHGYTFLVNPVFHSPPQTSTDRLSISIDLSYLDISHKWNHFVYFFICSSFFSLIHVSDPEVWWVPEVLPVLSLAHSTHFSYKNSTHTHLWFQFINNSEMVPQPQHV